MKPRTRWGRSPVRRHAAKRDANEAEILAALEAAGCDVVQLDYPGDALIGRGGVNYLLEIKVPGAKLKEHQREFQNSWRGQYAKVETIEAAFIAVGLMPVDPH